MAQTVFDVKGMHCNSCGKLIKGALESVDGVNEVVVSVKSGKVLVKFDKVLVDEGRFKEVIEQEGYKVKC